jgi:phosphoserine phosphatase RsbU/P
VGMAMRSRNSASGFATFVIMTWFDPTQQAFICSAGHPDPLWYSAELDQWMALSPSAFKRPIRDDASRMVNLPLGVIDGTEYEQFTVPIGAGDFIILYTDHYIEARSPDGDMLGVDGLRRLVAECGADDASQLGRHLEAAVSAHLGSMPIEDDRSLLVIRFDL